MTLLDRILANLNRGDCPDAKWPDAKGEYWPLCPFHADAHSGSFAVGEKGYKCFSCGASGSLRKLAEALTIAPLQSFPEGKHIYVSLSLEEYAQAKRLDPDFLRSLGIEEATYKGRKRLVIPYLDADGNTVARRYRQALQGPNRFRWAQGSKVHPYGLWRLSKAREAGYVILVEGESDCHTLWQHGLPALGVPGASTFKPEWAEQLEGLEVFLWQEPDQGGTTLAEKAGASLPEVRVIVPPQGRKDPSECHLMGDDLPALMAELRAGARPWSELLAERQSERAMAAREAAGELLSCPDILAAFGDLCRDLGLVGEERAAQLLYLAITTRLLDKPVSVVVKGPSSSGKSYLVGTVLRAFPEEAYLDFTSMSEHALIYDDRPVAHRTIVLYEASGLGQDVPGEVNTLAYCVRSLLSEGRIKYTTVEKTEEGMRARSIDRPGPTNLITTTTWTKLHAENETRLLSMTVRDDPDQTAGVFLALAARAEGSVQDEVDLTAWHALQTWLQLAGARRTVIPYATELASLTHPLAVRMRRDFGVVLSLVSAHAILHQLGRERDGAGRVISEPQDYAAVHVLVADVLDQGVEASVSKTVRETVQAAQELLDQGQDEISLKLLAAHLGLDRSTTSRRVRMARDGGYLRNLEEKRGRPLRLVLGDPLPEEKHALPSPDDLRGGEARVHSLCKGVQRCKGRGPENGSFVEQERARANPDDLHDEDICVHTLPESVQRCKGVDPEDGPSVEEAHALPSPSDLGDEDICIRTLSESVQRCKGPEQEDSPSVDEGHALPVPSDLEDEDICVHTLSESVQRCKGPDPEERPLPELDAEATTLGELEARALAVLEAIGQPAAYPTVANRLGVGTGPARKALQSLVHRGLVERLPASMYRTVESEDAAED